jgi:transaldolase
MEGNPLLKFQSLGQSVWIDFVRRGMLSSGELQKLIEEDGVQGVTSNPSIFEKAIAGSHDYDDAIRAQGSHPATGPRGGTLEGKTAAEIYQMLTVDDAQRIADLFRPVYDRLDGRDGFVSLEISPHLAYDTEGTIDEARRLWAALDRPNVLIKVPATRRGLPAIAHLISEGINVNVTLRFGLERYWDVVEAYAAGLQARVARDQPLERVASVASFFLSRVDVLVDPLLENLIQAGGPRAETAQTLHGQVAIASARMAYQIYKGVFSSDAFRQWEARGARPQRLLWASTSTKNPAYSDVKYVEALIGPETVNTMPLETLHAYRDHGQPAARLEEEVPEAGRVLDSLPELEIDLAALTRQLEEEGVQKFNESFDRLMTALEQKRAAALAEPLDRQIFCLDGCDAAVRERIASLERQQFGARPWRKDASL